MNHFNRAFALFTVCLVGCAPEDAPDAGAGRDAYASDVRFTDPDSALAVDAPSTPGDAALDASSLVDAPTTTPCTSSTQCLAGWFCRAETCGGPGICDQVRPETCVLEDAPVCGCDGLTYGSACLANAAGENVRAAGECRMSGCAPGGTCGRPFICTLCEDRTYQCAASGADC